MRRTMVGTTCPRSPEDAIQTNFHAILRLPILRFLFASLLGLILSPALHAQATGSFSGNVLDKSGSAIPGATITATSQGTGLARNTQSDPAGHYLLPLLPVGTYTVKVDASGFQSAESKDLRLQVDEARELDFPLAPANVVTSVQVIDNAVAVQTTSPSLGQVITSQQVSQLPLNGRDFVQLATLTAGATAETNPNSFFTSAASSEVAARGPFSLSVGGSRPNSTDWLLDNVDNNELTAGGIAIYPSIDDIQEFKVLTYTYSAEFGTRAGPTVLVTTKSGTNNFHGSLFEFVRNTDLDAKSYFASSKEKFNLNQFGGSVGGPIFKNKTFFFVDGEQKYQLHGITFTGLVPSLAMRNGDFSADPFGNPVDGIGIVNPNMIGASTNPTTYPNVYYQCDTLGNPLASNPDGSQAEGTPCNKIPAGQINNIGQAMMNLYPAPNANNAAAGYNFVNVPVRQLNDTKFDGRLDQTFSEKDTLFGRFSYDQAFSYVPGGSTPPAFASANAFGTNQRIINHARNAGIGETHVFSPTIVNQATFGYNRIFDYISSQGTGTCASALIVPGGIPNANLGCPNGTCLPGAYSCGLVSTIVAGGYWAIGDRGYSPFQGGTNIFSFRDSLDLVLHKHDIHVGLDFRRNQMNVGTEAFQDGFWIIGNGGNFTGLSSANVGGNPAGRLSARHHRPRHPRPDLRRPRHRTPLVDLSSLRRRQLAGLTLARAQSRPRLGSDHARHRSPRPPRQLRSRHRRCARRQQKWGQLVGRRQHGYDRSRAPHRRKLEGLWQRQDGAPRRLLALPRLSVEPGRERPLAESAFPRRIRRLYRCRLRLCYFLLRHRARAIALRHQPLQRIRTDQHAAHTRRLSPARSTPSPPTSSSAACSSST